jgi:hypothetical protein
MDGFYTIKNIGNGKVLDVASGSTANGANVQVYTSNGTCAQKWRVVKTGNNYELLSACSGRALDVASGATSNGTNIQVWDRNSTNAQKWSLTAVADPSIDNGTYVLTSKMSGRVLDVSGAGKADGTNIQTWVRNYTAAQNFAVTKGSDGYYTLRNDNANKVVDVASAGTGNGTNIHIWSSNGTCAQKWKIEYVVDNYFAITSACSGKSIDMGGVNRDGANVHLWDRSNSNNNQLWQFVKL